MHEPTVWSEVAPLLAGALVLAAAVALAAYLDPPWWVALPGMFLMGILGGAACDAVDRRVRPK